MNPSPQELKLTPDLLEYARAVALKEAPKHCGSRISYDDVVQEAILHLLSRPPKFDPSRGASEKTLIYTIVQRAVIKYAERERKHVSPLRPFDEPADESSGALAGPTEDQMRTHRRLTGKGPTKHATLQAVVDEMLIYIDNEESRALCRLFIECDGNTSATARRMGMTEGAIRYRLKMLAPKLLAAGFNPFSQGGDT
ncbi:MAG TPA: sigma-70 family RNA polymerase sigma factor [Phycisphaerae bacterium]|nr:sigma-70 family RNA polymerase sigma factor [Phycisphaerae bacterium]HRR86019.1 sigma-70 family RNA polymerase sigma factor [Phycisphaerae bacterium]